MNESSEKLLFDLLNYTQPNKIIKICTTFKKDFFSKYSDDKNIDLYVLNYNLNEISNIEKNFSGNDFYFLNKNDIVIFENDSNDPKSWEDIVKIFGLISNDNFPMVFLIGFLNLKFLDNGVINGDLFNSYDFLEKLIMYSEELNFDLSLEINSSDICCLYLLNDEINQIFKNQHDSDNLKEIYFNQLLFKELEIIKFKKEISELRFSNSHWINRNSILTKTKEDLIIQNESLNQKAEELMELNSHWINRNSILSKTKNSLFIENQKLSRNITNIETKLNETNKKLFDLENESEIAKKEFFKKKSDEFNFKLIEKDKVIKDYENKVKIHNQEIIYKDTLIQGLKSKLSLYESKIKNFESKLINKETEISNIQMNLTRTENSVNLLKDKSNTQLSKLNSKDYCIRCFKEKVNNNQIEINYLKNNSFVRKMLNPFSYVVLCFKSNPEDLKINYKLFKALKNSQCFDIGFYLNNNADVSESKWCKYFSPELHYVCKGFDEKRKFNKKYHNLNSKKDLLEYILNCH